MKLRHAATLALVGWYLMVRQTTKNGPLDESLPLEKWQIFESFDSAVACQQKLNDLYKEAEAKKLKDLQALYLAANCIPSDDPRLAK